MSGKLNRSIFIFSITAILICSVPATAAERAPYNIDKFIEAVPGWVGQFRAGDGPGEFSYMPGRGRPDLYGTTDIFYLLYTLDMLELTDDQRRDWMKTIARFQNKKSGWFGGNVTMHSKEHATAYAVGALKLLGVKPPYPLTFKKNYETPARIAQLLEGTMWNSVWSGSHVPSGAASALINTGDVGADWADAYFDWLDREVDPATGYWMRRADGSRKPAATRDELGGAFHFYYIYTYLKRPLPYPEKIIDTTISVQQENGLYHDDVPYCIDLDGVFSIIEAYKQTDGYREADVRASLERTLAATVARLNDPDFVKTNYLDSHKLVGAVAALAEIQAFAPELLKTPRPLKSILAASPFI